MGTYTEVVKKLEKLAPEDADYEAKKEARRKEKITFEVDGKKKTAIIDKLDEQKLGALWVIFQAEKARLESRVYDCNLTIGAIEKAWLDVLERTKKDSARITDIGLFTRQDMVSIKIANRDEFIEWAETEEKLAEYTMINYQRVASDAKNLLTEGEPLPPGIEAKGFTKIHFTKAK